MNYIIILFSLLTLSCGDNLELKNRKLGKLFASVDTSRLYDSTLIHQYPFLSGSNDFMKVNYVNKWVDRKILLKNIYDEKFNLEPQVQQRLERFKEEFLIDAYLNKVISENKIPKDVLLKYYNDNIADFSIPENEYKYQLIYFNRKDESKKVHTYLKDKKKYNFNALPENLNKYVIQKEIIGSFTPDTDIVSKGIKKKLSLLKIGGFSQPLKYDNNYIIVKLLDKRVKGEPYPFIEVEGKIMLKEYSKFESKKFRVIIDSVKIYSDVKIYINGEINE